MNLKRELSSLPLGLVILVIVNAKKYLQTNIKILKILCNEKKFSGIYLTINRSYDDLLNMLKLNKIDVKKLFFIDAITKTVGGAERRNNYLFIGSPQNLTEVSITIEQVDQSIHDKDKFLFLDSVSTLLVYNHNEVVTKFIHFLTMKMRELKMRGVLITLEKEVDEKMISLLSQFSDKVITVNGGE